MLYDRPYMRARPPGHREFPTLKWLLIASFAVFVLQCIVGLSFRSTLMNDIFALSWEHLLQGKIWTLASYAFLHDTDSPFHLLFNMFALWMFGRYVQEMIGAFHLLRLYLLAAVGGGLLWLLTSLLHLHHQPFLKYIPLLGASGAVTSLFAIWCLRRWYDTITIHLYFIIPITCSGRSLLLFYLIYEISCFAVFELLRGQGLWGIAHSAHLGGLAVGCLYHIWMVRSLLRHTTGIRSARQGEPVLLRSRKEKLGDYAQKVNISPRHISRAEVDRILDKINDSGFGSLTSEEKEILDKAGELFKR